MQGARAPERCAMSGKSLLRLTLHYKVILWCLALVPMSAGRSGGRSWEYEETHSDSRDFAAGGILHVRLSVGDVHIKRGDAGKINLRYTVKSRREHNVKNAQVDFEVTGNDATIEFHAPLHSNTQFDVELEVPMNTNLDVHGKVGDLTEENVEADKELELGFGDIRMNRQSS